MLSLSGQSTESQYRQPSKDEVDLVELWNFAWGKKWLILVAMVVVAILATVVVSRMPNVYRAEVLLAPVPDAGGGKSSGFSQLGGLAALAGVTIPSASSLDQDVAVLNSRNFLWSFIEENNLMPLLFSDQWDEAKGKWKVNDPKGHPTMWDAYRLLTTKGVLDVDAGKKGGMVSVAVEWRDADLAARWSNALVAKLNEYLRKKAIERSQENLRYLTEALEKTQIQEVRQAIFELISHEQKSSMLATTQKEFAFQVLDAAIAPDQKVKPKRTIIVVLSTLIAGCLVFAYLVISNYSCRKSNKF